MPDAPTSAANALVAAARDGDVIRVQLCSDSLVDSIDCRNDAGWTALQTAASHGHVDVAQFLLRRGASIERRTPTDNTPLHLAAARGDVPMIELLCRAGADVQARSAQGSTALHLALGRNDSRAVWTLLDHGASIDAVDDDGETVLLRACVNGEDDFVLQLLKRLDDAGQTKMKRELVNKPRDVDNMTPLNVAAERGHVGLVQVLVRHGAALEIPDTNGFAPLTTATIEGHEAIVQFLLASGADTETTTLAGGSTPLVIASQDGLVSIVDMLLAHGANVGHIKTNGYSALHLAAMDGHTSVVASLLKHQADPEIRHSAAGWTPLLGAAENGRVDVARLLMDHGADVNGESVDHWTPLSIAARNDHMVVCALLLERGAMTERRTSTSMTPLLFSAVNGNVDMINLLCRFGADVDAHGPHGQTALHLALERSFTDVVSCLLERGASVTAVDDDGYTVLMQACRTENQHLAVHILETLHETGMFEAKQELVNTPDHHQQTPLFVAAGLGELSLVERLVRHGANLETANSRGVSPLQCATTKGWVDVVQFLLASGADTDTIDVGEMTPLLMASVKGFASIVEMLLAHGALIDRRGINGFSALHCAAMNGHARIVASLLKNGADPEIRQEDGWTPLVVAAQEEQVDVVQCLLDHGVDINTQSFDQWTALNIAALRGHASVCEMLLERGASTTLQTTDAQTALHLAAQSDHRVIAALLVANGADPNARDVDGHTAAAMAMMEGFFATAAVLDQVDGATEYDDKIWPRHCLYELYGETPASERDAITRRPDPPWFIDRSSIDVIEPFSRLTTSLSQVSAGTWNGSRVLLVEPMFAHAEELDMDRHLMQRLFRSEVSKLYPLRHPHVMKLYGACHCGEKPCMVMEHPQNGTLRSFVAENKHRTWAMLRDVALGVQYLHERGIVHRNLMGDNILVGDDGLVKLAAFGYGTAPEDDVDFLWESPEVILGQNPTYESDVYALGMCIVEVVSGKLPYAFEAAMNKNVKQLIMASVPPSKPAEFSTREWAFVAQMIASSSRKRLKISDVVAELTVLAAETTSTAAVLSTDRDGTSGTTTRVINKSHEMEQSFMLVFSLLNGETETTQVQVFQRLYQAWETAKALADASTLPLGIDQRIQDILTRFKNELQAQASTGHAARFAAQRRHASRIFSFHNEIDLLLTQHNELHATATTPTTGNVHAWRERWHETRHAQLQALRDSLKRVGVIDAETATCLLFELTSHRDAYPSIPAPEIHAACETMRSMPGVHVPEWFIPHYEVAFDAFRFFSKGAFGSVHHGEWMGSRAVIKKVFADDDAEFEKEVAIWSQLYHPHVLQLFGACHVGEKFLVSEFASLGQLDRYLHGLTKQPARREREVWRTLYEAALGLQYLHGCGIVHCDLKCNNILIGRDGKAKVSDYGLSRIQQQQNLPEPEAEDTNNQAEALHPHEATYLKPTRVGAPRWKAPEVLNGAEPTVASDTYGFGMCVVEAVTGEYPWGMDDPDELVSDHVRRGRALFEKPHNFSEAQWALVVGACRFDPKERLSLAAIVAQLEVFVQETAESGSDATPEKLDCVAEPVTKPKTTTSWNDSAAFSEVVDNQVAGPPLSTMPAMTSYEESW